MNDDESGLNPFGLPEKVHRRSAPKGVHKHREAFVLMMYRDVKAGVERRIWNSRDGITPMVVQLDGWTLCHDANDDVYAPEHIPALGDHVFVDLTLERAREKRKVFVERWWGDHTPRFPLSERFESKEEALEALAKHDLIVPGVFADMPPRGPRSDLVVVDEAFLAERNLGGDQLTVYVVRHPANDRETRVTLRTTVRAVAEAAAALPIGWWNGTGSYTAVPVLVGVDGFMKLLRQLVPDERFDEIRRLLPPEMPRTQHHMECGNCAAWFDARELDQVLAHQHAGPVEVTGITGAPVRSANRDSWGNLVFSTDGPEE